jgi:alpha-L-fucosidase 2
MKNSHWILTMLLFTTSTLTIGAFENKNTEREKYLPAGSASLSFQDKKEAQNKDLIVWYKKPATSWLEALPLGNGLLGAMVFGGTSEERLILNEGTLYAEEPGGRNMPDITRDSGIVYQLIRNGQNAEADDYATKHWLGRSLPCYQPLGDLRLVFDNHGVVSEYVRELDLSEAVAKILYRQNGISISREAFVSYPDHAIILNLKSDKPGSMGFRLLMDSQHPTLKAKMSGKNEMVYTGQVPGIALRRTLEYVEGRNEQWKYPEIWNKDGSRKPYAKPVLYANEVDGRGMFFEVRVRVLSCDGTTDVSNNGLIVKSAANVVLAVSIATSYNGFDKSPSREGSNPSEKTLSVMKSISGKTYGQLRTAHVADYRNLFGRVSLKLGNAATQSTLPTDERLKLNEKKPDPSLAALYYQFGRYLMIASSRPGGQPSNLQGIWNVDVIPPWGSAYTMNVNLNMNYWGVETGNLSECHEPLFQFLREVSVTGGKVAKQMYHRPGWVLHHNTSIWRDAQPVDWFSYVSLWPMASGWLCEHLWEHYQFTLDHDFLLNTAYPIMKGAAEFYDSWLVKDQKGRLLTPVSDSPENMFYYTDKDGVQKMAGLTMGSTLDMAIIKELFRNTIKAGSILNKDEVWLRKLESRYKILFPFQIGSRGQMLEYYKEYKEVPPRHDTSPYYPLFPSDQITPESTPELAAAEQKLLQERGRRGGGWPGAWLAGCWARLGKGDSSINYINRLVSRNHPNLFNGGGTVFQIDANLGTMAAIGEMLLQSHTSEIVLLPALPKDWSSGSVKGLCARGGFIVDMTWKDGKLTSSLIKCKTGTTRKVRYMNKTVDLKFKPDEIVNLNTNLEQVK